MGTYFYVIVLESSLVDRLEFWVGDKLRYCELVQIETTKVTGFINGVLCEWAEKYRFKTPRNITMSGVFEGNIDDVTLRMFTGNRYFESSLEPNGYFSLYLQDMEKDKPNKNFSQKIIEVIRERTL